MEDDRVDATCGSKAPSGGPARADAERPCCPVCGGRLVEIRAKLQCAACHRICESCCEGGRG